MITRIFILLVTMLIATYYIMLILHLIGCIKMTKKRVAFEKCLIPFYYWIY